MHAAVGRDELRKPRGRDGVSHDGRAGVLAQQDRGDERDEAVAVELLAVCEHRPGAVHVGIKDDAEIGMAFEHRRADAVHRLRQLGVRHMVGEMPVGVEIAAAGCVRAERGEHALGKKAARAVSGIHNNALAREGLFVPVCRGDDLFAQYGGIGLHEFALRHAPAGGERRLLRGQTENFAHVRALRAARGGKEFESVAVPRQVARRDHDRRFEGALPRHGRHEHRRGGAETEIGHRRAARGERFAKRFGDRLARKARVAPDTHAEAFLSEPRAQKARKAARDGAHRRIVERDGFALHARERHTAHVAAVLQFCKIHIPSLPEVFLSSLFYRAGALFATRFSPLSLCRAA